MTTTCERAESVDIVPLLEKHQTHVWCYLRVLGCEANLADDLTQEAFLLLMTSGFTPVDDRATRAWLRQTAKNRLLLHWRSQKRLASLDEVELADRIWSNHGENAGDGYVAALESCLKALNDERAREILRRRYGAGENGATVAAALGLSEANVYTIVQRAKAALKDCIESKVKHGC